MTLGQKKKRFEGLIHFKDSIRQIAACLQASLKAKLATNVQSKLVRQLDKEQEDVFYLLLSSGPEVGQVQNQSEVLPHHVLTRFVQKTETPLVYPGSWQPNDSTKVSAWLDPADQFAVNGLYRILSQVCNNGQTLDLNDCQNWGSLQLTFPFQSQKQVQKKLTDWHKTYQISPEPIQALLQAFKQTLPLLSKTDALHLSSDGIYVSLIIEGHILKQRKDTLAASVQTLCGLSIQALALNLGDVDQISLSMPIRQRPTVHPVELKSLIIVKDLEQDMAHCLVSHEAG